MKKLTPFMWLAYLLGKQDALNKQMQQRYGYSTDIVDSLNSLTFKVLQSQLNEHTEQNLVFSPLSMLLVVSIMNYGFGDLNTKARSLLLGNLNLNNHRNNLHQLTGSLLKNLTASIGQTPDTEFDLLTMLQFADYLELSYLTETELGSNYNASVDRYDFFSAQERNRALNETYRLIRQHTKNQLNLFSLQHLPKEASRLNIYSTLHLNSNWMDPFNSLNTFSDRFYNQNGKISRILFMARSTYVNASTLANRDLQLVEIPFEDNQFGLIVIYSSQRYALHEMLFSAKSAELNSAVRNLTTKYINVRIPRFTVERQFTIQELLKPLRVDAAFDCKLNALQRFGRRNRTCLDFNLLYTRLRLDEQGANAVNEETGFYGQKKIDSIAPKLFIQSPFAFIVRHTGTGAFVLAGLINHF